MNTFVVKSNLHNIEGGKYIGMTKDLQYVYIYRSYKIFKDANPDLNKTDYTVIEKFDESEFDFRKYNVCPDCGGLKAWYHVSCDKPMNGNVLYDEDGFVLFSEEVCVYCICNDVTNDDGTYVDSELAGTYIGYLEHELNMLKRESKDTIDELFLKLLNLQCYVKSKSTCETCKGDQEKMYEFEKCTECGLPGTRIFLAGG